MKQRIEADPHSYAEPDKVTVTHVDMELTPDFKKKTVSGLVELSLQWHETDCETLVLDTKKLAIEKIEALDTDGNWNTVNFKLLEEDKFLGTPLHIQANAKHSKVKITYQTSAEADGLQWLKPAQTATKSHPYLYSHSEPINARSWIPLQDTPEVRQTYTARINTPKELRAVMSAENDPEQKLTGQFEFKMVQTVPSYLIAFAVGNIHAIKIGPRSVVYSEPGVVEEAAKEFEDTEKMMVETEKLYGPYPWDNYDILVMPPSFPMGGMENPRMTFATPTIIAGDKSLVSVIAHEMAHSWSGNLVTNARWSDIWLNEGFTTYVQNRIVEIIYGKEMADQEFLVSINGLREELKDLPEPDQHLVTNLIGRDPHDGFSNVAYFKGAWFLKTLEKKFGREIFDNFVKEYFKHFSFQSITTSSFTKFFQEHLLEKYPGKYSMEEAAKWIYQPGVPADAVVIDSKRFKINDVIRQEWLNNTRSVGELNAKEWSSNEWQYFLSKLPQDMTHSQLKELDDTYHLTGMKNDVVAGQWYKVAIDCKYNEANQEIKNYLLRIGRRYLVAPLYDKLLQTEEGKLFAQQIYKEARPTYHSVTRGTIDEKFEKASVKILLSEKLSGSSDALKKFGHFNTSEEQQKVVNTDDQLTYTSTI